MPVMLIGLFNDQIARQADQILWKKVDAMPPWARCLLFGRRTILGAAWYEEQKVWPTATRTRLYVRVANAFYDSHEWRAFRSSFLAARPTCEVYQCDKNATIVHHVPPSNVAATIIELGLSWVFEEDIEYTQRLAALCNPHHQYVHGL